MDLTYAKLSHYRPTPACSKQECLDSVEGIQEIIDGEGFNKKHLPAALRWLHEWKRQLRVFTNYPEPPAKRKGRPAHIAAKKNAKAIASGIVRENAQAKKK